MVRKHEDSAIEALKRDVKKWFLEEFGMPIPLSHVDSYLNDTIGLRIRAFLIKRISHLSDEDFLKFKEIWEKPDGQEILRESKQIEGGAGAPQPALPESVSQVANDSGVAKASEASPNVKGKGVRGKGNLRGNTP